MTERWKPESGEWYWYVGSDIVPHARRPMGKLLYGDYYESGNCFRTEEETKAAAEKVKALLLSLHEPEDGNSQKTPISESLQQEDCKKRTFVRPSHTTPEPIAVPNMRLPDGTIKTFSIEEIMEALGK